jgi:hypothetical protein
MHEATVTPEQNFNTVPLLDQLQVEHDEKMLAHSVKLASLAAEQVIPDPTLVINTDEWNADIMFGNVDSAFYRLEIEMVNNAAKKQGIKILKGDSLKIAEGPRVIWDVTDTGAATLRYSDPGGMLRNQMVKDREVLSAPFDKMAERLRDGELEVQTDNKFSLAPDQQDLVFTFMGISQRRSGNVRSKYEFIEKLYELPVHVAGEVADPRTSGEGVYFDEEGNLLKILKESGKNSGIYRGMYFEPGTRTDPSDTSFNLGIEIDKDRAVLDKSHDDEVSMISFLESRAARSIIDSVEEAGLLSTNKLREILASISRNAYDSRYGNNYSELTREVAKIIGVRSRGVGELFEDPNGSTEEALRLIDLAGINNGPTRLLFSLLQQSIAPDRNIDQSDVPVFNGEISAKAGSCKDAELYFAESIDEGKYSVHDVNGIKMLHKHSGVKTAINLETVMYKGVEIPAGGLFQRHFDKESKTTSYAFIRVTSFAFNQEEAADAFTWQYDENVRSNNMPSAEFVKITPY